MTTGLTALVLAGGNSTRFGRDKARVLLGRKLLLEWVYDAVASFCDELVLVTSPYRSYDSLYRRCWSKIVYDLYPDRGPLAGLYTGLGSSSTKNNIVVGCDMPFLNPRLLEYLVDQAQGYDAVVPMVGNVAQTLHAVYSKHCLEAADELLDQQGRGLQDLLVAVRTKYATQEEIAYYDPTFSSFFNINTITDLCEAQRRLTRE